MLPECIHPYSNFSRRTVPAVLSLFIASTTANCTLLMQITNNRKTVTWFVSLVSALHQWLSAEITSHADYSFLFA